MTKVLISIPHDDYEIRRLLGGNIDRILGEMQRLMSEFRQEESCGVEFKWSPKRPSSRDSKPQFIEAPLPFLEVSLRLVKVLCRHDHFLMIFENNDQGGAVISNFWDDIERYGYHFDFGLMFDEVTIYLKNRQALNSTSLSEIITPVSAQSGEWLVGTPRKQGGSNLSHVLTRST